ncbi:amino acid ABC transporter permease [Noviherbaspirillum galbum]|uniref:Amino acid ABC transporter permease n=1 Tax=Noviherbaspirillum galbum TaxID=2709383 RepID=A0A6B3SUF4_9BURK|nr:amino acid ABC transporter permease [Noviherbaspirillum galbum]NEX61259.1 amino acid ABC transporter permease [Noviherbaspirillum galbum]
MDYEFDFSFFMSNWRDILDGVWLTVRMSALSIALGFGAGAGLAVARVYGKSWMQTGVRWYVDVIRNTPLVIQAFWLFFGLAALHVRVPAFTAAILALVVNVAAYTTEIIRAGMESIPKGQLEAAECLGLKRWRVIWHVILPQAVEKMYPSLISQFVLMMLATSIMSQISAEELTAVGYRIQSETFRGFEVYIVIAVVYLVLSWLLRLIMEQGARIAFPRRRRIAAR